MNVIATGIPEVLILEPRIFTDQRGSILESYNRRVFEQATGVRSEFVQDNLSISLKNVVRGLHYQVIRPQGKLVRAVRGEIFDVAVDLRRSSRTFGRWVSASLTETNGRMMWIPPGFAHGLLALSERADVLYKMTEFWAPEHERTVIWTDRDIAVSWPLQGEVILSAKDASAKSLSEAELYP
jgi:dTDP-4-dehydrorhamnose 3,5-epimerase